MKTNLKLTFLLAIAFCIISSSANATIYYVRQNGGTNTQCTGTTDADYPGSGTGVACALNHPSWVNTLTSSAVNTTTALGTADTLVIVNGSYRIGCQNNSTCSDSSVNVARSQCNETASYDCYPTALPDNVTVIGCTTSGCGCTYGWGGVTTCSTTRPELWGAGNAKSIINVTSSSGVTIKDIEITDHANCNFFGGAFSGTWTCRSGGSLNNPSGLAGQLGIDATSATNLTLTGVNIHGVGYEAMRVTNVNGMTITGSNFNYTNIGMNNDNTGTCTTCGLSGAITIDKSSANWNGCIEDWQNDGTIIANTCCSQTQGCSSADSIGFAQTGGDFILKDSDFSHNTADGPDLLYLNRGAYAGTGSLTVYRSRVEGNAGNSLKGPNDMYVEDSFLISNCGFFQGQSFTYDNATFDHCRTNTGGIAIEFKSGDTSVPTFYNNTITSNGDIEILTGGTCTTGIDVVAQGNILLGGRQWNDDSSNPNANGGPGDGYVDLFYNSEGTCLADFVEDYNVIADSSKFKETDWSGAHTVTATSSNIFTGTIKEGPYSSPGYYTGNNYYSEMSLKSGSSALGISNELGNDNLDFNYFNRGATWDAGAVEYGSTPSGGSTTPTTSMGGVKIRLGGGKISQ